MISPLCGRRSPGTRFFVISDEVYEHINFSQQGHASVLAHPQLRERAVAVSSFGKTLSYDRLESGLLRCLHLSAPRSQVHPVSDLFGEYPGNWRLPICHVQNLSIILHYGLYRQKRDILVNALNESRLGSFTVRRYILFAGGLQRRIYDG